MGIQWHLRCPSTAPGPVAVPEGHRSPILLGNVGQPYVDTLDTLGHLK